ncbi:hypothetical protein F5X99DRAFT_368512 [Biscogniauxia marginata]|nr:hypothetical protein F5X99DRAFT_368512 [Biscogniauxia marginata]
MNFNFFRRQQARFERSNLRTWDLIRRNREEVERAAASITTVRTETEACDDDDAEANLPRYPLSRLERLPEELQIYIMKYLDYDSLYRLSQTTSHFLKLSFDATFEADPSWRAFRHTADGLGDGPRRRILDGSGTRGPGSTSTESHEQRVPSRPSPCFRDHNAGVTNLGEQSSSEKQHTAVLYESDDEGETMLSFMTRQSRK